LPPLATLKLSGRCSRCCRAGRRTDAVVAAHRHRHAQARHGHHRLRAGRSRVGVCALGLSLSHRCRKATVATAVVNHHGLVAGRCGAPSRCRSAAAHPPIGGQARRRRGPQGHHPVAVTSIVTPPSSSFCFMSKVIARFSVARRRERGKRIMQARVFTGRSSSGFLFTRNHHATVE
jgi:hypothetical protein